MPAFKTNFRAPYADTQHTRIEKLSPINLEEMTPLIWRECASNTNPQGCISEDLTQQTH